jgi:hypothetical protein
MITWIKFSYTEFNLSTTMYHAVSAEVRLYTFSNLEYRMDIVNFFFYFVAVV